MGSIHIHKHSQETPERDLFISSLVIALGDEDMRPPTRKSSRHRWLPTSLHLPRRYGAVLGPRFPSRHEVSLYARCARRQHAWELPIASWWLDGAWSKAVQDPQKTVRRS